MRWLLAGEGLVDAFVVGGGYKYCQLGEGNCFLRIPAGTELRPIVTGWFSEFTALAERKVPVRVYERGVPGSPAMRRSARATKTRVIFLYASPRNFSSTEKRAAFPSSSGFAVAGSSISLRAS